LNEWGLWSQNNSGIYSFVNTDGKNAVAISGTTSDANSYGNAYRFQTKTGYYYSISGWIKGKNATGNNQMRLDFEYTPAGKIIQHRDKNYLKNEISYFLQWGIDNNVPMYVGEFGLYNECFKDNKGGLNWVKDVIEILKNANINFTYHDYHETGFGIYKGDERLPDPDYANNELIVLFKNEL
jgi:endoglucanase